jgi:carbon-monoxide dehydrogenase medium subunit
MRDFVLHSPATFIEALDLIDEHAEDGRILAGGTALVVLMKQSLVDAEHLISLQRVPGLEGIRSEGDSLHIGALTRHREVETSALAREWSPLLSQVFGCVATVRIRNVATVGGALGHADPAQDPPAGLIALDASVKLTSRDGERLVPIEELFEDYYETSIRPGEMLTEVIVPAQARGARSTYLKFLPRTADDYATIAVAVSASLQDGRCRDLRIGLAAAGPTPVRAVSVERELEGQGVNSAMIRRAAEAVVEDIDPLDDFRGSAAYKRDMAVVFTRRALERTLGDQS